MIEEVGILTLEYRDGDSALTKEVYIPKVVDGITWRAFQMEFNHFLSGLGFVLPNELLEMGHDL